MNIKKIENNKNCVWWSFEGIEFYWEKRTSSVTVSGKGYDRTIYFAPAEEATAAGARKEIKAFIKSAFGV